MAAVPVLVQRQDRISSLVSEKEQPLIEEKREVLAAPAAICSKDKAKHQHSAGFAKGSISQSCRRRLNESVQQLLCKQTQPFVTQPAACFRLSLQVSCSSARRCSCNSWCICITRASLQTKTQPAACFFFCCRRLDLQLQQLALQQPLLGLPLLPTLT
jgi:hypothetical protein